jgi:hypothetical protein
MAAIRQAITLPLAHCIKQKNVQVMMKSVLIVVVLAAFGSTVLAEERGNAAAAGNVLDASNRAFQEYRLKLQEYLEACQRV